MRSETNMFSHPTLEPTYSQEGQPALLGAEGVGVYQQALLCACL